MAESVKFEVDFLVEAASANNANVGLPIRMNLDVGMQIGDPIERFAALVARIRFDCSVCQLVSGEIAWLTERSTAYVTFKRLLAGVYPLFKQNINIFHFTMFKYLFKNIVFFFYFYFSKEETC